jgi:hypothetical protein
VRHPVAIARALGVLAGRCALRDVVHRARRLPRTQS